MAEQASNENNKGRAYNVAGTVTGLVTRTDTKGRPYTYCRFECSLGGRTREWTAMAFGKGHVSIAGQIANGQCRLYVKVNAGETGSTLAILGMGAALLSDEQKAARASERKAAKAA